MHHSTLDTAWLATMTKALLASRRADCEADMEDYWRSKVAVIGEIAGFESADQVADWLVAVQY
jgi:hypothetical protein